MAMDITTYFIPAFAATVLTVATGCGMAITFDALGRQLVKSTTVQARAMYFFFGLLFTSWLLLLAGMAGVVSAGWIRLLPWLFIAVAVGIVIKTRSLEPLPLLLRPFQVSAKGVWGGIIKWAVIIAAAAFFIISLAPPTDADSLDYHLGVPAAILNSGGVWFDKANIHFRMFGFGELLNLPGVAAGCPQLGAFIQFLAFLYLLALCTNMFTRHRFDVLAMCLGIPVLVFLLSAQKHQLTGIAATCAAFYALQDKDGLRSRPVIFLFWALLVFAIGIKYSFIISAAALVLLLALKSKDRGGISRHAIIGLSTFLVFAGPLFVYKAVHFGDPLSPLLEQFKAHPDPVVIGVQRFLHDFKDSTFPFPINLLLPSSPSNFTTVIGLGTLVIVLFFFFSRGFVKEKIAVVSYIVLTILLGQTTARFFLEPFFWLLPLFLSALVYDWPQKLLFTGFRLQLLALLPVLLLTAYFFMPGLFSDKGREKVMNSFAVGYAESRWIDSLLPPDAKVCCALRSRSLVPRENFPIEYLSHFTKKGGSFGSLDSMAKRYGIDYYVVTDYDFNGFGAVFNKPLVACKSFTMATRNPLNRSTYTLCIYKANP